METVVVERTFEQPVDIEELQASEDNSHWCLEAHNVRYIQSFISPDRRRAICVYEAPDAESVRIVNATTKMPYDRVWSASMLLPKR